MNAIPGFSDHKATFEGQDIVWSMAGDGPALLMLHGFPQTRALWAEIAPQLASTHQVICPDLRGYGDSGKPKAVEAYSFRQMARDQVHLLRHLGHAAATVIGHDRGARVGHRLALDAPTVVDQLALLDIVPTHTLLTKLRRDVASAYYHWFFLAQPAPFPETMIKQDPDFYFHACLTGWGAASLRDFSPDQLHAYQNAWRDADCIRGMCNDYRAALAVDVDDDKSDLNKVITCPTLILYGSEGVMGKTFDLAEVWRDKCRRFEVDSIPGGHFFVDTHARQTLNSIRNFI